MASRCGPGHAEHVGSPSDAPCSQGTRVPSPPSQPRRGTGLQETTRGGRPSGRAAYLPDRTTRRTTDLCGSHGSLPTLPPRRQRRLQRVFPGEKGASKDTLHPGGTASWQGARAKPQPRHGRSERSSASEFLRGTRAERRETPRHSLQAVKRTLRQIGSSCADQAWQQIPEIKCRAAERSVPSCARVCPTDSGA